MWLEYPFVTIAAGIQVGGSADTLDEAKAAGVFTASWKPDTTRGRPPHMGKTIEAYLRSPELQRPKIGRATSDQGEDRAGHR